MKNYEDSNYALNKKNKQAIVYRLADGSVLAVTAQGYLAENPDKTEDDFFALKALSDADYLERDRNDYRQSWKNLSIHSLEETGDCAGNALEYEVIERPEQEADEENRRELAMQALESPKKMALPSTPLCVQFKERRKK